MIYVMVVNQEAPLKNRIKPFFVGLTGDSGAGKNHLTDLLQNILGARNCLVVEGDNYHKWERGDKNWENLTHLNPQANNLFQMQEHAERITRGLSIQHHHYDHNTGKFTDKTFFEPKKTIIVQGLHSFYLRTLRNNLHLRIFLNPSESVRLFWKVQRDVKERGHSLEKVMQSIEKRKSDSESHIQPQKESSDWIIEMDSEGIQGDDLNLFLRCTFFNDEPISKLIEKLAQNKIQVNVVNTMESKDRLVVTLKGPISAEKIQMIAEEVFPHLRQITRSRQFPLFKQDYDGLLQLFFLSLLERRLNRDGE